MGCEHFCVSLGGGRGQCVCADGYYIELDRKSCLCKETIFYFIITACKRSCGKVMFLHVSVILFTGGGVYPSMHHR